MRAVDTNVLVRLIVRDDPHQATVVDSFISRGAWVSVLVLAETIWVLGRVYKLSSADLANGVEMLLKHDHLLVQDPEAVAEALVLYRAKPSLRFSDCLILELARKARHLPLGTFDRTLGKRDGAQRL